LDNGFGQEQNRDTRNEDQKCPTEREGFTQQDLGSKIGVNQTQVSLWETNQQTVSKEALSKLVKVIGKIDQDNGDCAEMSAPFGRWLRDTRNRKQLSVPQLAKKSRITATAIYAIEAGKSRNPQQATRTKLEKALAVKVPDDVSEEAIESQRIEGLGSLIDFDPHDKANLPEEPGVYVFYDISERPVYVGRSDNIRKRVLSHDIKKWFIRPIVETAAYVVVKDNRQRNQIEQLLIKFMKSNAILNKQGVDRDPGDEDTN
jgi:transcriptional regulator with XRE-family HTH domain